VWGYTSPGEHPSWGMHIAAGGWVSQHLWQHYTYTKDKTYLQKVYPALLKSAEFYLDWLVKDPRTGKLVSKLQLLRQKTLLCSRWLGGFDEYGTEP
jgi:alpha-L-fucosidase 2